MFDKWIEVLREPLAQVDYHKFDDWSSKTIERAGKKYRVSLNLEAVKQG